MNRFSQSLPRAAGALVLALGLLPNLARAQGTPPPNQGAEFNNAPAGEESKGDPLYGYVGTAFLAFGAMFVVCKSARR
jgi:hypothetical protein